MPNMDKTGPQGMGPLTGRGMGSCGNGMRRGCGRGFGRAKFFAGFTKDEEKKILEANLKELELEKETIQNRLKEI